MSEQSESFADRVRDTIAAHAMLSPGARVLAAVSGGPDSMALLHVLRDLGYEVVVAHLDHMTRDGESAGDAAFVEGTANELGLPVIIDRRPVESESASSPESFEQTARAARYQFLEYASQAQCCDAVATGHTADDVAETVLWRILRGTSVDGIAGIPPVRTMGKTNVVRPLIRLRQEDVLNYLSTNSIAFRQDSSNTDRRFVRNRIRHEVLPLLEREYNPKVREALVRLAALARDDTAVLNDALDEFLDICLDEHLEIDRSRFADGAPALQRRVIQVFAQRHGIEPTFERTEAAREFVLNGRTGAKLDLGGGTLTNLSNVTRFVIEGAPEESVVMAVPGESAAFGRRIAANLLARTPSKPWAAYCTPSRQVFDADILGDTIRIRSREPGDRFTPFGMSGTRKLQDYFVDEGIPQDERDRVPIVEADGRIAWIVGGAIDAAFAVTESTERVVELEVIDAPE